MLRYHDWHLGKVPDFWSDFYKHGELIKYFAHVNNVLASKSGSYSLLNFYDILRIDSHTPGIADAWVPLEVLAYIHKPEDDHPHQYLVSDEWLAVESIYDKHADPDIELHPNINFRLDRHPIGYVDPAYLLRFSVIEGKCNGARVIELQSKTIELSYLGENSDDGLYKYWYQMPDGWTDLVTLKHLYNNVTYRKGEEFVIQGSVLKSTHELPRYPNRLCFYKPLPVNELVVEAAHKGSKYIERTDELRIRPTNARYQSGDYKYLYDLDEHFSNVYELYDPLTELTYTREEDFMFDPIKSTIAFKEELPIALLYMSKAYRADTRLNDEYGQFIGFSRFDSPEYRDSMEALMRLFYGGPTRNNLVSVFNVMLNQPVAKYGNEKILSMAGGKLITDKYTYTFGETPSNYKIGDIVDQYHPFGKAVSIDIWDPKKPNEKWWEQRPVELFQKYSNTPLTDPNKNILMDTFLKSFVGHVRVNLDEIDRNTLVFNKDLWETILDGIPARSDFILSAYSGIRTIGGLSVPTYAELPGCGIYLHSVWSKNKVCDSPEWLYPPDVVRPRIEPEGLRYYQWYVGSRKYHILNEGCEFEEFWRDSEYLLPYVEPNMDRWWYRFTDVAPPASAVVSEVVHVYDGTAPTPDKSRYFPRRSDGVSTGNSSTTKFDAIPGYDMQSDVGYASIPPEIICNKADMHGWMFYDTRMTSKGIEANVHATTQKYVITSPIDIGYAPKHIAFKFFTDLVDSQKRTWIDIEYGQEGADKWTIMPSDNIVRNVTGKLYLKIIFHPYASISPVFSGFYATVSLPE